ncbi:MAG: helix-turn-helix domain-containing protein [Lepagella sp.]
MLGILSMAIGPEIYAGCLTEKDEMLLEECEQAAMLRKYTMTREKGEKLKRQGEAEGCKEAILYGESYILRGIICMRDTVDITARIGALQERVEEAEKSQDWRSVIILAHPLALYNHFIGSDYSQASLYAFKKLNAAKQIKDEHAIISSLNLLSSIYFTTKEASGYTYALEAYSRAKKANELPSMYVTACNIANYLYNQQKFTEALKYLKEGEEIAETLKMESEKSYLYSFYGDIYKSLKQPKEAEEYYKKSFGDLPETSNYDKIYARICYAQYLMDQSRFDESTRNLEETLRLSDEYKISIFNTEVYYYLSICYEYMGDISKALENYKKYNESYQRQVTEAKAKEFALLDLRYRIAEEKSINASQRMALIQRNWIIVAVAAALVLLIIAGIMAYLRTRKKMRLNKETVSRYLEALETERELRARLEEALNHKPASAPSGLTDDKQSELFTRFNRMMTDEKIYRNSDLSLEKAAEMLNTNRTYLSQVVNEQSGLSFPVYINSFRLKEAIELLSNPDNDEPLKNICFSVGFSTTSAFYTLFRQKTGMAPSVFRQNVKDLRENGGKDE